MAVFIASNKLEDALEGNVNITFLSYLLLSNCLATDFFYTLNRYHRSFATRYYRPFFPICHCNIIYYGFILTNLQFIGIALTAFKIWNAFNRVCFSHSGTVFLYTYAYKIFVRIFCIWSNQGHPRAIWVRVIHLKCLRNIQTNQTQRHVLHAFLSTCKYRTKSKKMLQNKNQF